MEVVSDNVSSTSVYFTGEKGYRNYVKCLNEIAQQYKDSKYATSARIVSYNGQTAYVSGTLSYSLGDISSWNDNGAEYQSGRQGDNLYIKDLNLIKNAYGGYVSSNNYFLASRNYYYGYSSKNGYHYAEFRYNSIYSGSLYSGTLYVNRDNGTTEDKSNYECIRPILTLNSNVSVKSGDGSKDKPYVLS